MAPVAASDARDQQIRFLQRLFERIPRDPPLYLEIRFIRPEPELRDKTERDFFQLGDFEKVPERVRFYNGAGYHIIFSVCPRTSDHGGTKADVGCVPLLWADCDDPESLELIKPFTPQPSIIVASGGSHRRHFYWLLESPLRPDPQIESLLRGIRRALQGDARTDISSMMRLPGTLNPKYNPPSPCDVLFADPHPLRLLSDFDHIPRIPAPVMHAASFDPNTVATELPPRFVELMNQRPRWQAHWNCNADIEFPSGKNSPSEHIAALMVFCGEAGFSDDEGATIISCFYNREGMKPLHQAKLEATLRFMQRGRERVTGNPGPTTSPPAVDELPQNEQPDPDDDEEADARMPEFPLHTMTGIMHELASLYAETLEAPVQFFFFDALTFFGLHICRFVRLETHISEEPRLFHIKIGPTHSARKSHSQKEIDEFTRMFKDPHRIRRLYGAGSDVGVAKVLKEGFPVLLLFDEFRAFVNKASMKNQNLLSMTATLFHSTRYENVTKEKSIVIDDGHLAMVGACTVETYQKMFTPDFRDMGVLNRILLVGGKRTHLRPLPMMIPHHKLQRLADRLSGIIVGLEQAGQTTITFDAAALRCWEEFYIWLAKRADENPNAARLDSYGLRLLQLYAVTSQTRTLTVDLVSKVTAFLEYELTLRDFADPIDAETVQGTLEKLVLRNLTPHGMTDRNLRRYTNAHRYGMTFYQGAIQALMKTGLVGVTVKNRGGKWYTLTPEGEIAKGMR